MLAKTLRIAGLVVLGVIGISGCRTHMPHAATWPAGGNVKFTHPKPPQGGYYANWDPFAADLTVEPTRDVNPVRTQHVMVATVKDKDGEALPNRRVEWIISEGGVGDIVEVDESGWRASRGYKVDNRFAVSNTNNCDHVLDMGNDDPADDVHLKAGQTWCVITSPVEGDSHIAVYAPGIYDWQKHKAFVTKHWYDVAWKFPPADTNPVGTQHELVTTVMKHSDGTPLAGYAVSYKILDGPGATLQPGGRQTASVETDTNGMASVMLRQTTPAEGTNNIEIDIIRPEDVQCCKPAAHIATGRTSKTWVGPRIAITKDAPPLKMVDEVFEYDIRVSNPAQVAATNVTVSDTLPDGIAYVSSSPTADVRGQMLTWMLGSLGGGQSRAIRVSVRGMRTGVFENCASVVADYNLSDSDCATTKIVAPRLALEKTGPAEVLICDPITYTLVVRNTGDGSATNVKIVDQLPDGLVAENGRRSLTFDAGTLEGGAAKKATFTVKATRTGSFVNRAVASADAGLTGEAELRTIVRQPILAVTKSSPGTRFIGRSARYEISVMNRGDAAARDTVLVETVPAGTQFVEASDGGRLDGQGNVTWSLGTLEPNASRNVSITVKPMQPGTVRNTATARAVCAEASASAELEVKGIPAILLEVVDLLDPIEVDANETYVITVTNQGSAPNTNVSVVCMLPRELQYVSSEGPVRATVDDGRITFALLPSLAPKASVTYRVVAKGTAVGDVRFQVTLTSDQIVSPVEETESTHIY